MHNLYLYSCYLHTVIVCQEFLVMETIKLVIFLLVTVELVSSCPVGWIDAGGEYCYLVSPSKMNWPTAQVVSSWLLSFISPE